MAYTIWLRQVGLQILLMDYKKSDYKVKSGATKVCSHRFFQFKICSLRIFQFKVVCIYLIPIMLTNVIQSHQVPSIYPGWIFDGEIGGMDATILQEPYSIFILCHFEQREAAEAEM